MSEPDIDARFPFLPLSDQKRIDEAFLSQLTTEPLYVASQLASDTEGGGFVVDEPEPSLDPTLKIHISSIPRALESIQLPSDARVLITFRHAAIEDLDEDFETWKTGNERDVNMDEDEASEDVDQDYEVPDASSEPDGELSEHVSDDDYNEKDLDVIERPKKRRRKGTNVANPESDSAEAHKTRDGLAEEICLDSFALFFPEVETENELRQKEITIQDLQRVTKLLGIRIKAEEMVEMLNTFSTGGRVNLQAFGTIMAKADFV
ncbi:hypothetical protein DL96DRAFT_1703380 [Flagelloscypha sp. PMI_526]|nr:hypothetical protein DL96DRAFT_1703380 [Flagelloscypha sp. PMI_526]